MFACRGNDREARRRASGPSYKYVGGVPDARRNAFQDRLSAHLLTAHQALDNDADLAGHPAVSREDQRHREQRQDAQPRRTTRAVWFVAFVGEQEL
ncbi:MAG TPA: hypothetical protein VHX44_19460 [Planctomycetota bacterium]|jgi:hypothetical protein|nr:hypothetical protein [Planctomycetota bacterium]